MANATAPRFSSKDAARIKTIKSALKTGAGGADKRLRTELHGLYKGDASSKAAPVDPFQQAASQAADIKYNPAQQSIAGEQNVSDQTQKNIPNWYDTYLNQVQSARDATATAYQQAEQRVRDAATASTTQAVGQNNQTQQQMSADAARRGATLDPSTFATANQAAQSRQGSQNSFAGLVGSQGATATTAFDNRKTTGAGDKVAQQVLETRRRGSIDARLSSLLTEKGQYQNQQVAALKDAAQKSALENAAFGLKQQTAATSAATSRGTARSRSAKDKLASGKDAYQRAHGLGPYKPSATPKGGAGKKPTTGIGSLTGPAEQKIVDQVSSAMDQIKALQTLKVNGKSPSSTDIRKLLAGGGTWPKGMPRKSFNADFINAAYDVLTQGYLSNPNIAVLHARGIHIPPKWLKPKGTPAAPNFQGVSGGAPAA